jgi:NADH-quinone oxidoreductase subunit I
MILDLNYYERHGLLKGTFFSLKSFFIYLWTFMGGYSNRFWPREGRVRGPVSGRPYLTITEKGDLRCISCGLCQKYCPSHCIEIVPHLPQEAPLSFQIEILKCVFCGLCVDACPVDAIRMGEDQLLAGPLEQNWVLDKNQLAFSSSLNEGKGILSKIKDEEIKGSF